MNPFGQGATVVDIAFLRIGDPGAEGRNAGLDDLPFVVGRQIADAASARTIALLNDRIDRRYGLPEELGDVGAVESADEVASEDAGGGSIEFVGGGLAAEGGRRRGD